MGTLCAQALRVSQATRLALRLADPDTDPDTPLPGRNTAGGPGPPGRNTKGVAGPVGRTTAGGPGPAAAAPHAAGRVRIAAGRAAALLGEWRLCRGHVQAATELLALEDAYGGSGGGHGGGRGGASDSHAVFRRHQRSEALAEADALAALAAAAAASAKARRGGRAAGPPSRGEVVLGPRGGGTGGDVSAETSGHSTTRPVPAIALLLRRVVPLPPPGAGARDTEGGSTGYARDTEGGSADRGGAVGHAVRVLLDGWGGAQWCARLDKERDGAGRDEMAALRTRLEEVMGQGRGADGGGGTAMAARPTSATALPVTAPAPPKTKLDLAALFGLAGRAPGSAPPPRYRVELGCGLGEWLAAQAAAAPGVQWVGVELMARRAYATAARLALAGR